MPPRPHGARRCLSRPRVLARTLRTVLPGMAMIAVSFGLARYGYGLLLPEMRADSRSTRARPGSSPPAPTCPTWSRTSRRSWVADRWGPRVAVGPPRPSRRSAWRSWRRPRPVGPGRRGDRWPALPRAGLPALRRPGRPAGAGATRDLAWSAISSGTGWGVAVAGPMAIVAGDQWRTGVAGLRRAGGLASAPRRAAGTRAEPRHRRTGRPQLSWTWFVCPRSRPLLISAVLVGAGSAVWWSFSVDALAHGGADAAGWANAVFAVCGVAGVLASVSGAVFQRVGLRRGYLAGALLLGGLPRPARPHRSGGPRRFCGGRAVRGLLQRRRRGAWHLELARVLRPSGGRARGGQHRADRGHPGWGRPWPGWGSPWSATRPRCRGCGGAAARAAVLPTATSEGGGAGRARVHGSPRRD